MKQDNNNMEEMMQVNLEELKKRFSKKKRHNKCSKKLG